MSVDLIPRLPQYFAPIGFPHPLECNQSSQKRKPSSNLCGLQILAQSRIIAFPQRRRLLGVQSPQETKPAQIAVSPRLLITPQANLPRSLSAKWRGECRIWKTRLPFVDNHFRPASREGMRCITLRTEPIAVVGQFSTTAPPPKVVLSRWKQVEAALTQQLELAITSRV